MTEFELTQEDYDRAAKNGISAYNLKQRFEAYAWDKERAITQPLKIPRKYEKEYQEAKSKGSDIDYKLFSSRLKHGWTVDEAINRKRNERKKKPDPYIEIAKKNGISKLAYRSRRNRGWTRKNAATEPIDDRYWKGRRG